MPQEANARKQEEDVETELAEELADEVPQVAIQAIEDRRQHRALRLRGSGPGACELPVYARPTHEAEHHAHGRQEGKEHPGAGRSRGADAQSLERTDAGRNENQWKDTVERPRGPACWTCSQESGEHIAGVTVENLRIVEASGQIGKDAQKGNRASNESDTADKYRPSSFA